MNATATATIERPVEMNRPRPHFSRDLSARFYEVPSGRKMGAALAAVYGADRHLWVLQQPPEGAGDSYLPPVCEFDAHGRYVRGWGGPDHLPHAGGVPQWPVGFEGLEIDGDGNLWVFGYKPEDHAVLKCAPDGTRLLRIGQRGVLGDDSSRTHLGRPTSCYHDTAAREVFVSDGYDNHRVIAFNSDTGAFTRMWGAYGKDPVTLSPEESFGNPVHKVACGPDGLIYVADRIKNRVQCFERMPGGARFVREVEIAPGTFGFGSAFDIRFAPDGRFIYVADGTNNRIWILDFESFEVLGWTGSYCEVEGTDNLPSFAGLIHRITLDSDGNIVLVRVGAGLQLLRHEGVW